MIYLGDQINALQEYRKEAVCWLGIKIKGRLTKANSTGFNCGDSACPYCTSTAKRRSGLEQAFRDLLTPNILTELIDSKPPRLFDIFNTLQAQYIVLGKTALEFINQSKLIFVNSGYTDWFLTDKTSGEKWNYRLANLLNQHTCTYCNREYIFTYENKSGGKGMVPQFDHWFAKTDYPLLALSFYNLIPSCATCNAIKSKTTLNLINHLHPYVDKNIGSTYSFSYLPLSSSSNKIILKRKSLLNTKGIDTVKALNLPLIYEGHSSKELQDLIDLKYKYSKNYLNILLENTFGHLGMSEQEKYRLIFGIEIDEDQYHRRIFSKFKSDIINELLSIDN